MAANIGSGISTVTVAGDLSEAWRLLLSVRVFCMVACSSFWFGDPVPSGTEEEPPPSSTQRINSFRDIPEYRELGDKRLNEIISRKRKFDTFTGIVFLAVLTALALAMK